MKNYGANKATEFSYKQIKELWTKAVMKELQIEKWYMNELFELSSYYGYDDNGSVAKSEAVVLEILEALRSDDMEACQRLIRKDCKNAYGSYGETKRKTFNRNFV